MKRDEMFASIEALIEAKRPGRDDIVYVERRGDEYDWRIVAPAGAITPGTPEPDAWMSFSTTWPDDPQQLRVFFEDLLAELEAGMRSAAESTDRCRWPADQPWTHPSRFG